MESGDGAYWSEHTLWVFSHGKICSGFESVVSDALSKELDSRSCDDYQIESSTDVCPCKKRCHFLMTQIALWYLMNFGVFFCYLERCFFWKLCMWKLGNSYDSN